MTLSMGPQHPSTHGVLRLELELDGEVVISTKPDILGNLIANQFGESRNWPQGSALTMILLACVVLALLLVASVVLLVTIWNEIQNLFGL